MRKRQGQCDGGAAVLPVDCNISTKGNLGTWPYPLLAQPRDLSIEPSVLLFANSARSREIVEWLTA